MGALLMSVLETRRQLMPILAASNESLRYVDHADQSNSRAWRDLSRREQEVLQLVAQGMTNPRIAKALFITPGTVKVHVHHILEKLGVSSPQARAWLVNASPSEPPWLWKA